MRRHVLPLLVAAAFGIGGCAERRPPPDDLGPVGEFALTERNGDVVRDSDLRGNVWVASFVFTRCTGPCPQVTATIARLQGELGNEPGVRFVTFTVDPEHDDPKELAKYAEHFQAGDHWLFLTGKQDELYRLLREGFHVPVEQNEGEARKPGAEVMHSTKLVVVDRRGHLRGGYFDGLPDPRALDPQKDYEDNLQRLRQTVAALLREAP
jgi:cytochrome oxidase Cu insertion factor (SCO1/SenC/PrrC family)